MSKNPRYKVSYTYSSYLGSRTYYKDAENYEDAVRIQEEIKRTDGRAKYVEIIEEHYCIDFENDDGSDYHRDYYENGDRRD